MKRDRTYHRRMAEEFLKELSTDQKILVISGTMKEREEAGLPPFDGSMSLHFETVTTAEKLLERVVR